MCKNFSHACKYLVRLEEVLFMAKQASTYVATKKVLLVWWDWRKYSFSLPLSPADATCYVHLSRSHIENIHQWQIWFFFFFLPFPGRCKCQLSTETNYSNIYLTQTNKVELKHVFELEYIYFWNQIYISNWSYILEFKQTNWNSNTNHFPEYIWIFLNSNKLKHKLKDIFVNSNK